MTEPRPTPWFSIAVLALVSAWAGCLSPSSSPPATTTPTPTEDPDPFAAGFTLQECFMPTVLAPFVTQIDQGSMPEGFIIVADDAATHTVEYRGLTCNKTDNQDRRAGIVITALRVQPPPAFMDPAIANYEMSDGGFVQGEILAPLLAWGNQTPELFVEAVVVSMQTPVDGALATGSVQAKANDLTMTMDWEVAAAGQTRQAARTHRLFLVDADHQPFRLVGAIDLAVSDSSVLPTGAGSIQGQLASSPFGFTVLPGKGAMVHSGFSVQMRPVHLPA